jgi:phenylacetate-CoA ligase
MKRALSRKNIWDRLPTGARGVAGFILGWVPVPILLGARFRTMRRFAADAEWWPAGRIEEYQRRTLEQILCLAHDRASYYRRIFDSIGLDPRSPNAIDRLCDIPTADCNSVMKHRSEMCARRVGESGVDECSTGGTGGSPTGFFIGADRSPVEYAYLVASWGRAGYHLGMPLAVLRGRIVPPDRTGLRHEYDPLLRHHYYSNFHMTDEDMGRYLAHIATIGPCFLHVYPSSVAALARFCRRAGVTPPRNIRGIIAESEIVYPEQRKMAEEVFAVRYFSCYGHSEKLVLAAECEHSTDYHVWPTYGYFELLDEAGKPVTTPGQRGEIVGTGFINTVMPFIRYRTGDYATYIGDHCEACGRQHTIIRDIRGHRTQEMLVTVNGSEISWTALNMHDDTFLRVCQFQFRQDTPGKAVLRIVPADGFGPADREKIQRNLGRKLDGQITFDIELTDAIPLTPRGKSIYVDQRIPAATISDATQDGASADGNAPLVS